MAVPYLGLRPGDPFRSAAAGALAGGLTGGGCGAWYGWGSESPCLVAFYLAAIMGILGAAVGFVYGAYTEPPDGSG